MKADNDQTMGVKIQKQRQNHNGQREKEQHLGKYPQPNLKKIRITIILALSTYMKMPWEV